MEWIYQKNILAKDNVCGLITENAMQDPLCLDSVEAVLDDYMIERTYHILRTLMKFTVWLGSTVYNKF